MLKLILVEEGDMANTNPWPGMRIDLAKHVQNKAKVPVEDLAPYWGKQVAWHADGTHIVAAADTLEQLDAELARLGIDPCEVVINFLGASDMEQR